MKTALEDGHYSPGRRLLKGETWEKWEEVSITVLIAASGNNKATGKTLTIGSQDAGEPAVSEEA